MIILADNLLQLYSEQINKYAPEYDQSIVNPSVTSNGTEATSTGLIIPPAAANYQIDLQYLSANIAVDSSNNNNEGDRNELQTEDAETVEKHVLAEELRRKRQEQIDQLLLLITQVRLSDCKNNNQYSFDFKCMYVYMSNTLYFYTTTMLYE